MKGIVCLFVALVIFAVVQHGESLKCYVCSTATDPKCSKPVAENLPLGDCTASANEEPTCLKKVKTGGIISRECGQYKDNICENAKKVDTTIEECIACEQDGCNSAPFGSIPVPFVLLLVPTVVMIKRWIL